MRNNTRYSPRKLSENGFTLVELIVVLVILALLAVMLVPILIGYIDKANQATAIAECRSCVVAAQTLASEAYAVDQRNIEIDAQQVLALAELESGKKIELIDIDASGLVSHLAYNSGRYLVTYCSESGCDECENDEKYNIVKSDADVSVQAKADSTFASIKDAFLNNYGANINNKRIDGIKSSEPGTKAYAIYNSLSEDQKKFLDNVSWSIVSTNVDVVGENNVVEKKTVYRIYFTTEKYTENDSATNVKVYKYNIDGNNGKAGQYEYTTTGVVVNGQVTASGSIWSDWSDTMD